MVAGPQLHRCPHKCVIHGKSRETGEMQCQDNVFQSYILGSPKAVGDSFPKARMRQTAPGSALRCHGWDKHPIFPSNSLFPHTIMEDLFTCMQGAPTGYLHRIQVSLCSQVIRGIQLHPVRQRKQRFPMSDTHGKTPSIISDPWKGHSSSIPGW